MKLAKSTSNGRVTIPAELRRQCGIKPGAKIAFTEKNNTIVLSEVNKKYFVELAGSLGLKGIMLSSLLKEKRTLEINHTGKLR
jgi:AbrB family looped-hinge helix DNA binding protein